MKHVARPLVVALVGPDQQDNLALGYLAAALEEAGHRAHMIRFNGRHDLEPTVAETRRVRPDVIGLGIPFQAAIGEYLDLARALRHRGFRGHLTCGGHVPTFSYADLLRESPAIDSVVRHEGEATLVEVVERLSRGASLDGVRGLVRREGDRVVVEAPRPLERELDRLPPPRRREPRLTVGGVPIAFLLTSRGCVGECAYCSIRAFSRDAGGPPYRLRSAESVADEIAGLRRSGVRVLFVQDDLFILPSERTTLERIGALAGALRARGIDDVAFWIKGRPESITPAVLDAARDLGALHVFIGVESASKDQLRRLGRAHGPDDNRRAIARCREAGILPSFNFMLFDPDGTLDDVRATLDLAEENLDLPWNLCRTEIYPGTRLLERLREQGRLTGDWRSWGYRMADDGAEILFRVARVCLHDRAFACESLLNKLISLSFARQVHGAFFPGEATERLDAEVRDLVIEVHRDTVERLRRLTEVAATARIDDPALRDLATREALDIGAADFEHMQRFETLWHHVTQRGAALLAARRGDGQRPEVHRA